MKVNIEIDKIKDTSFDYTITINDIDIKMSSKYTRNTEDPRVK